MSLSTTVLTHPAAAGRSLLQRQADSDSNILVVSLLTILALLVHGYHPYSEDGGLYSAGVKHLLDRSLYSAHSSFVDAHLRYSIFAPALAWTVRETGLSLSLVLFATYLASVWLTLFAVSRMAWRCFSDRYAQMGALLLTAAWLTIPVAGTSLMLMDPYLTARSITLPCTLLALVATLDLMDAGMPAKKKRRALLIGTTAMLVAILVHPLMAAYALSEILLLTVILIRNRRLRTIGIASLCIFALALSMILRFAAPAEPVGYLAVAASRYYWFLSQWQWYELIGLIAPVVILIVVARRRRHQSANLTSLASMSALAGCMAIVVALAFVQQSGATHLLARLQPLRTFQILYEVMIMILGAALGRWLLKDRTWRWIAASALFGGIMFGVQRSTYPSSTHLELPGIATSNRWQQAFLWIKANTPKDALFAMDANYISLPGEDAQSFRALAERSALPDFSKDGGETSITPQLTSDWTVGQEAQKDLSTIDDTTRIARLRPLKVNWIVLQQDAITAFVCPYSNALVKVCRLP